MRAVTCHVKVVVMPGCWRGWLDRRSQGSSARNEIMMHQAVIANRRRECAGDVAISVALTGPGR